jgi:phage-related minor tail protein
MNKQEIKKALEQSEKKYRRINRLTDEKVKIIKDITGYREQLEAIEKEQDAFIGAIEAKGMTLAEAAARLGIEMKVSG